MISNLNFTSSAHLSSLLVGFDLYNKFLCWRCDIAIYIYIVYSVTSNYIQIPYDTTQTEKEIKDKNFNFCKFLCSFQLNKNVSQCFINNVASKDPVS